MSLTRIILALAAAAGTVTVSAQPPERPMTAAQPADRAPAPQPPGGVAPAVPEPSPATAAPSSPTSLPGRQLIGDAATLVYRSDAVTVPGASEEARITWEINRKEGTWQSYLLYTSEDLPDKLFHPGFTWTLGPPRRAPDTPSATPLPSK